MKNFLFHSPIGLLAFFLGIFIAGIWMIYNRNLELSVPKSEELWNSNSVYDSQISKSDKNFWEKEILKKFKETSLNEAATENEETYRIILLPTFDAPIMVRIWRNEKQYFMITKRANGITGFGLQRFGKKMYEKKQTLTEEQWNGFGRTVEESMFWQSPSQVDELLVEDGATWFMQGQIKNRFQTISRINPTNELRESFNYLLKLSGFESDYKGY